MGHISLLLLRNLNGNLFEFISLDQPQKKRGARRDYLFCNEANELTWEDFFQLLIRTTGKIWVDYNPSDAFHWIYDKLLTRDDVTYIQPPTLTIRSWMPHR
jgi:phage terminase large subunit